MQLILLVILIALVVFVGYQALAVITRPSTGLPAGRLALVFVLCLVAGEAVALVVALLLRLFLPRGFFAGFGRLFFALGLMPTMLLYSKAKAWIIERTQHVS